MSAPLFPKLLYCQISVAQEAQYLIANNNSQFRSVIYQTLKNCKYRPMLDLIVTYILVFMSPELKAEFSDATLVHYVYLPDYLHPSESCSPFSP